MTAINSALELHDSDVVRVVEDDGGIVVELKAYIHRSEGTPGIDVGSGWTQTAQVRFSRGRVAKGHDVSLPMWISDGFFEFGSEKVENWMPLSPQPGPLTALEVIGTTAEVLRVEGEGGVITLVGEPRFVEEYDAD